MYSARKLGKQSSDAPMMSKLFSRIKSFLMIRVECSIQKPEMLPKNYALLKILKKTQESLEDKNKKIIQLQYQHEEQKFIASKKEDKSLCGFLSINSENQKKQNTQTTISDFSSDQILTAQIQNQQKQNECLIHKRPLELICVDHKTHICTQCALFGNHKGHDVRMEEDVMKEISLKVEVLMEMYQAMQQGCQDLGNPTNYDRQYNIFKQKQNETKQKIQDKFKEWRQALRDVEMKAIDSLYMNYQQFEDKFHAAQKQNIRMIGEAQSWLDKAKQKLDEYTQKTSENPSFIQFDMIDAKNNSYCDEILNQGEHLLEKSEKQKDFPQLAGLEQQYSQVKVQFDPSLEKKLINIARIIAPGHQEVSVDATTVSGSFLPTFSFNEDEDNPESISQPVNTESGLNISNISFNEISSPQNNLTVCTDKLSREHKQNFNKHDSSVLSNGSLDQLNNSIAKQERLTDQTFSKIKRLSANKLGTDSKHLNIKKKNDIPSMFKNEAENGELDLSNKSKLTLQINSLIDLSDMHVNELAKCIKSHSGHIKTLNLSKNRISDEGINHLIKALCESQIVNVNLQQNKFTEKCVEVMVGILKTNKTLKNLDLQNNEITSRLMKNKLKNSLTQIEILI